MLSLPFLLSTKFFVLYLNLNLNIDCHVTIHIFSLHRIHYFVTWQLTLLASVIERVFVLLICLFVSFEFCGNFTSNQTDITTTFYVVIVLLKLSCFFDEMETLKIIYQFYATMLVIMTLKILKMIK